MIYNILTIFPKIFDSYFNESIIKRAQKKGKVKINIIDIRNFAKGKHKQVDDKPYGGGPGMIMQVELIYKALMSFQKSRFKNQDSKIVLFDPRGKKFDQAMARRFARLDQLTMICGHYEGVDERVLEFVDEQVSVGSYVLTGGEVPAMIVVDAISRLIPGVLGKEESFKNESFSKKGYLEYPQYTRPETFKYRDVNGKLRIIKVPKVLLSGNHQEIKKWRQKKSKIITTHLRRAGSRNKREILKIKI